MTVAAPPAPATTAPVPESAFGNTEFVKQGMGYLLRVLDSATTIRLHRIKRRSEEISGDVLIRCRITGVKTFKDDVLYTARLNLSSPAARQKMAEVLKLRTPGVNADWPGWLDILAQSVMGALAEGEPIAEIGFDAVDWEQPRYAVMPLSPLGEPALLYGPGGSGKSLLALTMAVATASGRELLPGTTQQLKGPVLYLDWETNRQKINRRIISIAKGADMEVPRGIFYRRQYRPLAEDVEELALFVADHKIGFVVIDSAAQAIGHQGDYGDANEGALRLFEGIRLLGEVSTVIVDHVSKQELTLAGKKGRVPYGSVYKINYSRAAWEVRPQEAQQMEGKLRVALHDFKRNDDAEHPPIGIQIDWKLDSIAFEKDDVAAIEAKHPEAKVIAPASLVKMMLELLEGSRMKAPAIAASLGASADTVRTELNRNSNFERDEHGFWYITREHLL